MTTITYRAGTIAADSLCWNNDICCGRVMKIGRADNGSLWGIAGNLQYLHALTKWADKMEGDPPETKDVDFVVITPEGKFRVWEGVGWCEPEAPFHAIGTGSQIALGALAFGATAEQAVHIACDFDAFSGGDVVSLTIGAAPTPTVEPDETESELEFPAIEIAEPPVPEQWRARLGLK
jgi:hypothetical protein